MIERIVKMTFKEDSVEDFLKVFESSKLQIASFHGCKGLKLIQDVSHPNVIFTYSVWDSEDHLNGYRNSQLFNETWSRTKILFNDKPAAWSVNVIDLVK